jgi:hypothetical protein
MAISLVESQNIDELAGVFYEMLPGSGNPRLSFPTVAQGEARPSAATRLKTSTAFWAPRAYGRMTKLGNSLYQRSGSRDRVLLKKPHNRFSRLSICTA